MRSHCDATETLDTDHGIGNNADTDDDADGVLDTVDAFPLDGSKSQVSRLFFHHNYNGHHIDHRGCLLPWGASSTTAVFLHLRGAFIQRVKMGYR